ncbi:hypothetical protein ES708_31418 [subsurface metagenome]
MYDGVAAEADNGDVVVRYCYPVSCLVRAVEKGDTAPVRREGGHGLVNLVLVVNPVADVVGPGRIKGVRSSDY